MSARFRVFLASAILIASVPGVAYLSFALILILGWLPETTMVLGWFLTSALATLAVSFIAPVSHRIRFAVRAGILTTTLPCLALLILFRQVFPFLVINVGIAGCVLWIARKRTPAIVLTSLYAGLVAAGYLDWPGRQDPAPSYFGAATEALRAPGVRLYKYPLRVLLVDSESLWRIDAKPEILEAIALKGRMSPCDSAPQQFWRMPPYYWPRSLPSGARLYATPSFPANRRGGDGDHFFMLIDSRRSRGFVWFKNNF